MLELLKLQTVEEKEYSYNEKLAISQLKAEYGEEDFSSLPDKKKWKNIGKDIRTEELLKQFSDSKITTTNSEIGYTKSYHRFDSISSGFKEDSLSLGHPYLTLEGRMKGVHKSQIVGLKNRMLETMNEADSYKPREKLSTTTSYAYFRVISGNTEVGSIKTQYINKSSIDQNINESWENFEDLIKNFEDHHQPNWSSIKTSKEHCEPVCAM